jgi:hypothetical protein
MKVIEQTYISLLADVASSSGFSEIRGSYEGLQWCVFDAPKLEKLVLKALETGKNLDLEPFPTWLRRLAAASLLDAVRLRELRQLLLFCYKAYVTHDKQTTERSFASFSLTNHDVGVAGERLNWCSPRLLNAARRHISAVLSKFEIGNCIPHHGPGAVTTSKREWTVIYKNIEAVFPYSDWFSCYYNKEHLEQWEHASHEDIIRAKLIAVPKDSRGPRLICVHPAEAVWIQQALRGELERVITLDRSRYGTWPNSRKLPGKTKYLTPRGHIHFDDQTVNGRIAKAASRNRRFATLDMKEASDRLSAKLVSVLFGDLYKYFDACRAQRYYVLGENNSVLDEDVIHSYAPMGNATTFPVQSLVFWAICVASLQRQGHRQPGAVFVFGDDIEVPTECAQGVIDDLESFGLVVNREKSFIHGRFRESCGVDAFNGIDVTPVRWKTDFNAEGLHGMQALSDIAMRLRMAGYEESAFTAYHQLRGLMRKRYGVKVGYTNNRHHGGIAEYTTCATKVWMPGNSYYRRDIQLWHTPVWRLKPVALKSKGPNWNSVLESICSLERNARSNVPARPAPRRVRLELGWIPIIWRTTEGPQGADLIQCSRVFKLSTILENIIE